MSQLTIPEGYQQVMPYLILKGAGAFIKFMQDVFGAVLKMKHLRDEDIIMHAELQVGSCVIMFADATGDYQPRTGGFFIYLADADLVYAAAIAAGASAISPMSDQPYGRSGGVIDPFGNTWWITSMI
jgi:uncharacterized glyoxalase superfamily protein PhnB